jgi:hypothetical protein
MSLTEENAAQEETLYQCSSNSLYEPRQYQAVNALEETHGQQELILAGHKISIDHGIGTLVLTTNSLCNGQYYITA